VQGTSSVSGGMAESGHTQTESTTSLGSADVKDGN